MDRLPFFLFGPFGVPVLVRKTISGRPACDSGDLLGCENSSVQLSTLGPDSCF